MDTAATTPRTYRNTNQTLVALLEHYATWLRTFDPEDRAAAAAAATELARHLELGRPAPCWPSAAPTPEEIVTRAPIPAAAVALVCLADAIAAMGGAKWEALRVHQASALRALNALCTALYFA